MADRAPALLDVVALLRDAPEAGLARGQVGTIVDQSAASVLVEFSDSDGETIAVAAFAPAELLVLNYDNVAAE